MGKNYIKVDKMLWKRRRPGHLYVHRDLKEPQMSLDPATPPPTWNKFVIKGLKR